MSDKQFNVGAAVLLLAMVLLIIGAAQIGL